MSVFLGIDLFVSGEEQISRHPRHFKNIGAKVARTDQTNAYISLPLESDPKSVP